MLCGLLSLITVNAEAQAIPNGLQFPGGTPAPTTGSVIVNPTGGSGGTPCVVGSTSCFLPTTIGASAAVYPTPSGQSQNGVAVTVPVITTGTTAGCGVLKGVGGSLFSFTVAGPTGTYVQVLDTAAAPADGTSIPQSGPTPPAASFVVAPIPMPSSGFLAMGGLAFPLTTNNGITVCVSTAQTTKTGASGTIIITGQVL